MKQVVLRAHPRGNPSTEDFAIEDVEIPQPGEGEVLLQTHWLAVDPMIRFALDEKPMTGPNRVSIGEVIFGGAVSQVIASNNSDYLPGDIVEGRTGWREFAAIDPTKTKLRKIDPSLAPVSTALGVLGMPGQTAYACMVSIGRVAAGETALISAAGGAVGTLAGQIGKLKGARVIGIAGGAIKCAQVEALGFDACVDYKAPDYKERLAEACKGGVDLYIDNVGGDVTQAVLPLFKYRARMAVCGFIAYYGLGMEGPGPDRMPGFMRTIMSKGLEVRGFGGALVGGQIALDELTQWVAQGAIRHPETVIEGIVNAPAAFAGVFNGKSGVGKVLVKVRGE